MEDKRHIKKKSAHRRANCNMVRGVSVARLGSISIGAPRAAEDPLQLFQERIDIANKGGRVRMY